MPSLVLHGSERPLAGRTIIGRLRDCSIAIKDEAASRQHAALAPAAGGWTVEDLGSANGTKVNGKRISGTIPLADGDVIRIGETELTFHDDGTTGDLPRVLDHRALVGQDLAGHRVLALLGENTLGAVYRAVHGALGRTVALTVIDPSQATADLEGRLRAAVSAMSAVRHHALVSIHDCGLEGGLPWLSTEYVAGTSLKALIARQGGVDPGLALLVIERAAEALDALHAAGVVHGDLRPATVLLTEAGEVKVVGAGLRSVPAADPGAEVALERALFLAPEHPAEAAPEHAGDLYALGCLLYYLVEGQPPFPGDAVDAVAEAHRTHPVPRLRAGRLPAKLDEIAQGLLAKNPQWRFADMAEAVAELRRLRTELGQVTEGDRGRKVQTVERQDIHHETRQVRMVKKSLIGLTIAVVGVLAIALAVPPVLRWRNGQAPAGVVSVTSEPGGVIDQQVGRSQRADAATTAWNAAQPAVETASAAADWPSAERLLAAAVAEAEASPAVTTLRPLIDARRGALAREGEAWYRAALAQLPAGTTPTELAGRLRGAAELRDRVLGPDRADAESRYQEALTRIAQQFQAARRGARSMIEAGRWNELPALAAGLSPAVAGTALAAQHAEFSARCTAAAEAADLWDRTWFLTRPRLLAQPSRAVAGAAVLLLMGENDPAQKLLDGKLRAGDDQRTAEVLFNREGAVLGFDDPGDLQYVDIQRGEPRLKDGALRGDADEPAALLCTVAVGGRTWDAAMTLGMAPGDGQVVVAVVHGGEALVSARIEGDAVALWLAAGAASTRAVRPAGERLRLRFACKEGRLRVLVADQVVLEAPDVLLPAGANLRIECAGVRWALDDLQVVAGG
jgi:hypothetical protein